MLKTIEVDNKEYIRETIKTHFVKPNEDYVSLVKQYVLPKYSKNDVLFISEKIISICQNNLIYKSEMKLSFWAKFLSKFVNVTPAGEAVGNPYKMQCAINSAGLLRILFAAFCGAVGKVLHKKGWFYVVAGNGINGLDGFTGEAFKEYEDLGIPLPKNPLEVCKNIEKETNVKCVLVDANYIGVEILAKSDCVQESDDFLKAVIKDNPAGQKDECTPFVLLKNE